MATIAEVARLAGVSTATVSRVLNAKRVNPAYTEAVRAAVAELGYSPDRTARSLRRRYSDVIALVLPDIENPFFTSLARGVEDVAQDAGFSVVLCNSDDDPAKEARYLGIAASDNMAGVILAPASPTPELTTLLDKGRVVVVLDRPVADPVDQVCFDNVALGHEATRRLVERGHRRVACITGPELISTARQRAEGWRQALTEAGLPCDDSLLLHANFRVDGGREAMTTLLALEAPPDAVLATNNLVAVGALQVLHERPHLTGSPSVGVIGDLPFATSRVDDLVLVSLRPRELGTRAAHMFLERLRGLDALPRDVLLAADSSGADAPALRQ